jgi:hypothetical protein
MHDKAALTMNMHHHYQERSLRLTATFIAHFSARDTLGSPIAGGRNSLLFNSGGVYVREAT